MSKSLSKSLSQALSQPASQPLPQPQSQPISQSIGRGLALLLALFGAALALIALLPGLAALRSGLWQVWGEAVALLGLDYLGNGAHAKLYRAALINIGLLFASAPLALLLGLGAALMRLADSPFLRVPAQVYGLAVRGIPDVLFLIALPLLFEIGLEWLRVPFLCPSGYQAWQGNAFVACEAAAIDFGDRGNFLRAAVALGLVYGAFTSSVIYGGLKAVPQGSIEAARAYGMSARIVMLRIRLPLMWVYALPGLNNIWMLLIKATALVSLLQVLDLVYWVSQVSSYQQIFENGRWIFRPDRSFPYFLGLALFYLSLTFISQICFERLRQRSSRAARLLRDDQGS
jgi:polar amino acid transport system permease protein